VSKSVEEPKTALIVDDDHAVLTVLDALLTDAGFVTTCFQEGLPAIDAIAQQSFDVLVLDVGLPDTSGIVICERAREHYGSEAVIIILTADNRTERLVTALTLGADDFVPKPFDVDELLTRIDVKLKRLKNAQSDAAPR
jgi:two-component system, OmpR family, response regulator